MVNDNETKYQSHDRNDPFTNEELLAALRLEANHAVYLLAALKLWYANTFAYLNMIKESERLNHRTQPGYRFQRKKSNRKVRCDQRSRKLIDMNKSASILNVSAQ